MYNTSMNMHKSVLVGKDNEVIPILLELHAIENPYILDCTYNTGKMWKNLNYNVHKMDINSNYEVDTVGDFTKMPFENDSFDVIVFDPPHLPANAASKNSSKIFEEKYGITNDIARKGDNVSNLFPLFLLEAKRVLNKEGIVLAKIADLVHNHKYQWQHVDFINEVTKLNMTACDLMIKCDPSAGNLKSNKWKNFKHLRKAHCYWIVVRKSNRCEKK